MLPYNQNVKGLTDIPGVRVGHVSDFDAITGCTAILCDRGAVAGVEILGSASGTEETPTLAPGHLVPQIHGVLLAGGSAFGLEAASGVRRFLERRGIGFDVGVTKVPIVPAAIIFDLGIGKPNVRPNIGMGEAAAMAAGDATVPEGCVGAGTGATVGKVLGMDHAMKSGVGTYTVAMPGGVLVSALLVVNAMGDVRDPATNKILAGARKTPQSRDFLDTAAYMKDHAVRGLGGRNTTLAVVATNARLDKVQATKLAQFAGLGMARSIYPVNTMFDGDTVFALSAGTLEADINSLGIAAGEAVTQSVLRAVKSATTMGGVPGLAG